jgi:hypothetical protein
MKPIVELRVDGTYVGHVKNIEYRRDAVLVNEDTCREYAAGNTVVCDVELVGPVRMTERWRIVEENEQIEDGDQFWSKTLETWLTINSTNKFTKMTVYHIVRRKALVLE